jgi:hypothetical protein
MMMRDKGRRERRRRWGAQTIRHATIFLNQKSETWLVELGSGKVRGVPLKPYTPTKPFLTS